MADFNWSDSILKFVDSQDTSNSEGSDWLSSLADHLTNQQYQNDKDIINLFLKKELGGRISHRISEIVQNTFEEFSINSFLASDTKKHLKIFNTIGWTQLYRKAYSFALCKIMEGHVEQQCTREFDQSIIEDLLEWNNDVLYSYACSLLGNKKESLLLKNEFNNSLLRKVAKVRSVQLFEMVAEFPYSLPAVEELRDCANKTNSLGYVGKTFRNTIKKRLLHMGASTSQILEFYISMIKTLRVIDSSDSLLSYVAIPVRAYLQTRKDAVRCIVASLIEGEDSELHSELRLGGSLAYAMDEDNEEDGPGEFWEPHKGNRDLVERITESTKSGKGKTGKEGKDSQRQATAKGLDVLALLVSIYGSTDLFITEYRSLLADKLLNNTKFTTDLEVANLELLKIRFGEESLHSCEVMLKDVEDSKRVNNGVASALKQTSRTPADTESTVDFVIVSENYWPALLQESLKLHPTIEKAIETYQETYAELKKPRKIHPAALLGQVEIDLDFADGATRSFTVTPIQANIIMFFDDDSHQAKNLQEIADLCELELEEVRLAVLFWTNRGVLKEVENSSTGLNTAGNQGERYFVVVEEQQQLAARDITESLLARSDTDDRAEMDTRMNMAAEQQQKMSLKFLEQYVLGMLSSHGGMSLERLHGMIKVLSTDSSGISDIKYDMNVAQLRQYLQSLVDKNQLECVDGVYKVCKNQV